MEALRAGRRTIHCVYLADDKNFNLSNLVQNIEITHLKSKEITKITGFDAHQGICAKVDKFPYLNYESLPLESETCFLLLLHGITDTHNMGALIRTAVCAGVDAVVIPKHRSAGPTPAVSRISAGALEHVQVLQVNNMVDFIKKIKIKGVWVTGLDPAAQTSIFSVDFKSPLGIVIGGEHKGLGPLIKNHCDMVASIPQKGSLDSLNASVAGAVLMFEVLRQRNHLI